MNKFYITTPIYYVNDVPHVGSAYTTIAADVLVRYHKMIGDKTFFLTGTDEHGAKVEAQAKEAGKEPQKFVDEVAAKFQLAWDELNIGNDNFLRTTDPGHIKAVQKALQFMYDKGDIYKGKYEGLYCRGCEQYKSEKDLVDGKCPEHNTVPEKMSEECYMFKLSKYQNELLDKIKSDEFKIRPKARKNEMLSFYEKEGLNDIAFSRKKVKWGIPLPWDTSHTVYVWGDAFLNYLTGLGWSGPPSNSPLSKGGETEEISPPYQGGGSGRLKMWPPDVQLMSKDIRRVHTTIWPMRVHTTIWPAMVLGLGLKLPKQLFIHGFFLVNGQKMSKSLGNVIRPEEMVKKYGVDATRYLLMSAATFGKDGDIGWGKFDEKYNADLANGIGNLVARSITLVEKMQNVKIKLVKTDGSEVIAWNKNKINHSKQIKRTWKIITLARMSDNYLNVEGALRLILVLERFVDNYITETKPWELIEMKDSQLGSVMYNILEHIRHIAWMLWPFMPETADKIWESLGLSPAEEMKKDFNEAIKWGGLSVGTKVKKGEVLFPRI
jgi:methionyl-tRNA synthetase